jgi:hypothetical protein
MGSSKKCFEFSLENVDNYFTNIFFTTTGHLRRANGHLPSLPGGGGPSESLQIKVFEAFYERIKNDKDFRARLAKLKKTRIYACGGQDPYWGQHCNMYGRCLQRLVRASAKFERGEPLPTPKKLSLDPHHKRRKRHHKTSTPAPAPATTTAPPTVENAGASSSTEKGEATTAGNEMPPLLDRDSSLSEDEPPLPQPRPAAPPPKAPRSAPAHVPVESDTETRRKSIEKDIMSVPRCCYLDRKCTGEIVRMPDGLEHLIRVYAKIKEMKAGRENTCTDWQPRWVCYLHAVAYYASEPGKIKWLDDIFEKEEWERTVESLHKFFRDYVGYNVKCPAFKAMLFLGDKTNMVFERKCRENLPIDVEKIYVSSNLGRDLGKTGDAFDDDAYVKTVMLLQELGGDDREKRRAIIREYNLATPSPVKAVYTVSRPKRKTGSDNTEKEVCGGGAVEPPKPAPATGKRKLRPPEDPDLRVSIEPPPKRACLDDDDETTVPVPDPPAPDGEILPDSPPPAEPSKKRPASHSSSLPPPQESSEMHPKKAKKNKKHGMELELKSDAAPPKEKPKGPPRKTTKSSGVPPTKSAEEAPPHELIDLNALAEEDAPGDGTKDDIQASNLDLHHHPTTEEVVQREVDAQSKIDLIRAEAQAKIDSISTYVEEMKRLQAEVIRLVGVVDERQCVSAVAKADLDLFKNKDHQSVKTEANAIRLEKEAAEFEAQRDVAYENVKKGIEEIDGVKQEPLQIEKNAKAVKAAREARETRKLLADQKKEEYDMQQKFLAVFQAEERLLAEKKTELGNARANLAKHYDAWKQINPPPPTPSP